MVAQKSVRLHLYASHFPLFLNSEYYVFISQVVDSLVVKDHKILQFS